MKYKLKKYVLGMLAITFVLTGCSKNEDALATIASTKVTEGYVVKDGYIKFDNKESYLKVYKKLSTASELELKIWNSNLPFKSLKNIFDANLILERENVKSDVDPTTPISEIKDKALYSLLNEKGVLMCGDTIVKIKEGNLFIIPNNDFTIVEKITNGEDVSNLKDITKQKLCTEIKPTEKKNPDGMQKLFDRSLVSYVTSTYRELVHYEANVICPLFDMPYLTIKLSGVGQNLFIYWQPPFAHEMEYGRFVITGTTDNQYPFSFDSNYIYNNCWVQHDFLLPGWPNFIFNWDVRYIYKMNNYANGSGEKIINYKNTQF